MEKDWGGWEDVVFKIFLEGLRMMTEFLRIVSYTLPLFKKHLFECGYRGKEKRLHI
jgi:hypothetical protein